MKACKWNSAGVLGVLLLGSLSIGQIEPKGIPDFPGEHAVVPASRETKSFGLLGRGYEAGTEHPRFVTIGGSSDETKWGVKLESHSEVVLATDDGRAQHVFTITGSKVDDEGKSVLHAVVSEPLDIVNGVRTSYEVTVFDGDREILTTQLPIRLARGDWWIKVVELRK